MRTRHACHRLGATLAVASALTLAAGLDGTALAQNTSEPTSLQLPAQPLAEALTELGAATGVQVSFDPSLLAGERAPALEGRYTLDQALQRLLADTQLTYERSGDGSVTIRAASNGSDAVTVAPITVSGWRPSTTQGYRAEVISSATKTEELLVDVPASVSVVTADLIEDQNATTVAEALRNVPGVGAGPNPANVSVQEEVTIRGFESALVRVNGVQRRSTGPLSLANVASVEVLKGPFSVLYGDLSPGGFVNIQTKRPQREAGAEVSLGGSQVMSGDGTSARGTVDLTGPLNEDGTVLYRLIASSEGGSSFIDTVENERQFIAPSLSFLGLDDRLRVDVDLRYLRNDETFLFGVPARNGEPDDRIDYDTFLGADDSEKVTEDYDAELRAELELSDRTRIDGAITYHRNEHTSRALRPFGGGQEVASDDTVERAYSVRSSRTTDQQIEVNIIHELSVRDQEWRFLAGGDVRSTDFEPAGPGSLNLNPFDTTSVFDPDNDVTFPADDDPALSQFFVDQDNDSWGVYGQAEVWWRDRLKLLAGARYTDLDYSYRSDAFGSFDENPTSVDPRAGALLKLTPETSLYASYSTSFEQSFSFDPDNVEPLEAEQYEFGVKREFAGGMGLLTATVFDLTQENLVTTDPETGLNRQIGEAQTQGFELEVRGTVTERLQVQAGYTFLDNEISKDNDGNEGNRLPNVAEHEASLWASYRLPTRGEGSWYLGGGVFYESERFTGAANTVEMPGYVTTDLSLRYELPLGERQLSVRFGVKNVFDEEYYAGGFGEGISFRGEPRTAFATLTARF
ncbi:TonB-dependent siderophore receptor [Spiribacter halobius]|uniref:Secretin/TonB short N-terminal domain-containing protein n=1 Tax=Sediminicurvatus halobius TaxID=2182432 RepID=A0A2U2N228_9GAMM|nr:TonB-dependent receptor [Spiribacter halobius]PWG63132.1 hypothetical protein DEM34_09795 [Spiribacter halobius]UEX77582.1 TonB-dependent receptor [Spiribacter halobius]